MGLISDFLLFDGVPDIARAEWVGRVSDVFAVDGWLPEQLETLWRTLATDSDEQEGVHVIQRLDEQWIYKLESKFVELLAQLNENIQRQMGEILEESGEFNESAEELQGVLAKLTGMAQAAKRTKQKLHFYNSL